MLLNSLGVLIIENVSNRKKKIVSIHRVFDDFNPARADTTERE